MDIRTARTQRILWGAAGFGVGFVVHFAIGWVFSDKLPAWVFGGKYPTVTALVGGLLGSALALAWAEKRSRVRTKDEINTAELQVRRRPIGIADPGTPIDESK